MSRLELVCTYIVTTLNLSLQTADAGGWTVKQGVSKNDNVVFMLFLSLISWFFMSYILIYFVISVG